MSHRAGVTNLQRFLFTLVLAGTVTGGVTFADDHLFTVNFADGSMLVCSIEDQSFNWNEVSANGEVSQSTQKISDVKQLRFARSTVSQQVAEVRKLIDELQSAEFRKRNEAEKKLLKLAGPFQQILKNAAKTENSEARFRLNRVLSKLQRSDINIQADYDFFVDKKGDVMNGDSPGFRVDASVYGNPIVLKRDEIISISAVEKKKELIGESEFRPGFRTTMVDSPEYYDSPMRVAGFEKVDNDNRLKTGERLDKPYVYLGVKMFCEGDGNHCAVYNYKVSGRSVEKAAVCFDQSYESPKYKGVFRAQFCVAGQGNIRATTNRVGCYLQLINPPRTIVLEAYNRDDECVGICEAIESTSFVGIESDQDISYVRVLTNRHLKLLNEAEPDNDFAVDDFAFAPTKQDLSSAFENEYAVVTDQGDLIRCAGIEFENEQIKLKGVSVIDRDLQIDLKNVVSVVPPRKLNKRREVDHQAFAQLTDGSVVAINKIGGKGVADFPSMSADRKVLVGIWGKSELCRHANSGDFVRGKSVVVFPWYRMVVDKIELSGDTVQWGQSKTEIKRQTDQEFEDVTDPEHPDRFELSQCPPIWLQTPTPLSEKTGLIRTTDKQRFVLGGENGFELKSATGDAVVIKNGEDEVSFPISAIKSIEFPAR